MRDILNEIASYGIDDTANLMNQFYQTGNEMLLSLRNISNKTNKKQFQKEPRAWGTMAATKMVGVSSPTFRRLQNSFPNIDGIIFETTKNGKQIKKFTLQAINTLREKANTRYKRPQGSTPLIIAVSNLKGGVGKTETTVDLAKKIAIEGLRVLLLDQDAQGTATLISSGLIPDLEIEYKQTITNCLISDINLINEIIINTGFDGLDIIPANLAIQDCDLILPDEQNNNHEILGSPFDRLSKALLRVQDQYDVILIDCGPNLGMLTLNAIVACNGMIIPIPPNMHDYSSFIMYTGSLSNIFHRISTKKLEYFRILLSRHTNSNEALQMESIMRKQFGDYILVNHMCETIEVSKAANEIGTIYDISHPRGSREAYQRALRYLDDVNMEIINNFKHIWNNQSMLSQREPYGKKST